MGIENNADTPDLDVVIKAPVDKIYKYTIGMIQKGEHHPEKTHQMVAPESRTGLKISNKFKKVFSSLDSSEEIPIAKKSIDSYFLIFHYCNDSFKIYPFSHEEIAKVTQAMSFVTNVAPYEESEYVKAVLV